MLYLPRRGRFWLVFSSCILSACGGGSSESALPSASVSTNEIDFAAASPDATTPAAQTFSATVSAGTVYLAAIPSGEAIANVSYSLSGTTATITVFPKAPNDVGAGNFTGVVTVTAQSCADAACSRLVAGNRADVTVRYSIPPVVRDVGPYVSPSNISETVFIRGRGFSQFTVDSVMFGATPATSFTVTNDTQIQAVQPALAAGSYPVTVQASTSPGAILSSAALVVVDPPSYASTTLSYPAAASTVRKLIYDAQRQALLVGVDSANGEVLRYSFGAGGWSAPAVASVPALEDIALSSDGKTLLAVSDTAVTPLDAASLVAGTAGAPNGLATDILLKNLVITNDDTAVITTSSATATASTSAYTYPLRAPGFTVVPGSVVFDHATPGLTGDGSLAMIVQGDATLTTAPAVYQYASASRLFTASALLVNQNSIAPALSRDSSRLVLNGLNVYGALTTLLGTLPATTLAVVVKPDATRAYTYDSAAAAILSFDLVNTTSGAALTQVGGATVLPADPGSNIRMAISPDGGTLFVAGGNQIVIAPTPP